MANKKKFPDLTGDGKVTKADILKGRGASKKKKKKVKKNNGWTRFIRKYPR